MEWKNANIITSQFVDLLLMDKNGHYFVGHQSVDFQNFIVVTKNTLQEQGHYAPSYSTINRKYFVKYAIIE